MKALRFLICIGLFILAVGFGLVAAVFHLIAWPFYSLAIALAKGIQHANRDAQSQPCDPPSSLRDVPARVPAETR